MEVALDELIVSLQAAVAERRRTGDYPLGLEAELEAEFDGVLAAMRRHELTTSVLADHIEKLRTTTDAVAGLAAPSSNIPGGSVVHKASGRLVGRHTNGLAADTRAVGHETAAALTEIVRLFDAQRQADERQLVEVVAAVLDRVAVIDQLISAVNQLERRLDALELSSAPGE